MKILSWNVNGIRANVKKGGFDWLVSQGADIFCLQETKAEADQLPENVLRPEGYVSYFDHSKLRKGYSGVAIWTKVKPEKVEYGFAIEKLDQEGRQIALFFKDFVLVNIYFPNGGGGPERLAYKLAYYEAFLKYIEKLRKGGHSIVFCGDINTAHTEIDLARPKENVENTGFLPIERAWIDKVIAKGYVDIFRTENPGKVGAYTYWDMKTYARERNVGWRIDYFFISPDLVSKVKSAKIMDSIFGSDHCPISLEIS
jgi:exodeoxyribonuclease-3